MKMWLKGALVAVGLCLCVASLAMAEEPFDGRTLTWRGLFFTVKVDNLSMEQPGDQAVGARELAGLASYEDGEVAMVDAWVSFYSEEGQSHYGGYALFQFPDGSTQTASLGGCLARISHR